MSRRRQSRSTCTSKLSLPIAKSTALGTITARATFTTIHAAASRTTVHLSDTGDKATAVTAHATVATITATPALTLVLTSPTRATVGTSYTITLSSALKATGKAYHDPKLVVTLPAGEHFTGTPTQTPTTRWTCALNGTKTALTCTSKHALTTPTYIPASTALGKVKEKVVVGATLGTKTTTATLSDPADGATSVVKTATVKLTAVPKLTVATSGTPTKVAKTTTYTLTVTPSLKATGGPANHHPVVTITLPAGFAKFTGAPAAATWNCVKNSTTKYTCTSTKAISTATGPLGTITAKVLATAAGATKTTTVTLADTTDGATTVTTTAKTTITGAPVMTLAALGGVPGPRLRGHHLHTGGHPLAQGHRRGGQPPPERRGHRAHRLREVHNRPGRRHMELCEDNDSQVHLHLDQGPARHTGGPRDHHRQGEVHRGRDSKVTSATLADTADHATPVTKTATVAHVYKVPALTVKTSGTPTKVAKTTTYTLTVTPSLKATGGPAYTDPVVTITLPAGFAKFTGAPAGATWNCVKNSTTKYTCTSTKSTATGIPTGPLGTITAKVLATAAGATKTTTVTLADTTDGATTVTTTAKTTITGAPVMTLAALGGVPAHAYVGTTYTLVVTPSLKATGGVASHHPSVVVTVPTGFEKFTTAPAGATWSCAKTTTVKYTCTSTKALPVTPGALGTITAKVKFTGAGTAKVTSATLADTADHATPVTKTATVAHVYKVPALTVKTSGTPTKIAKTTTYTLTVTPALKATGGPAYTDPVVTITLPAGFAKFTGAPAGATWNCVKNSTTKYTCTSTKSTATGIPTGPLGTITAKVLATAAGATKTTTVTLADTTDGATTVTTTAKTTITGAPVMTLAALGGVPAHAYVGTTYTLVVTPSLKATGGVASHHPSVVVTVPTGFEKFTTAPAGATWSCAKTTTVKYTCTSTKALPITPGALGTITAKVKFTGAGTAKVTSATLADTADHATPVTKTATVAHVYKVPALTVKTSGTPAKIAKTTTYTLTVTPALKATGGPAYTDPVVTITLPAGFAKFTVAPAGATWNCVKNSTTKYTCTSTKSTATGIPTGPLGTITAKVLATAAGATKTTTVTLADTTDGATTVTTTAKTTITGAPVMTLAALGGVPAHAYVGTTYTLVVTPSLKATGGVASHHPSVVVTVPTGFEKFTTAPAGATWSCAKTTTVKYTCTSTKALPITPGALGTITAKVKFTGAGTGKVTSATLADTADHATPVTKTATVAHVYLVPVLAVSSSGTPAKIEVGTTYSLTLSPSLKPTGGLAFNHPTVSVTLPEGFSAFTGTPTAATWHCVVVTTYIYTCTSTKPTTGGIPPGSLGTIKFKVLATTVGATKTMTSTLADATDGAIAAHTTATTTITATPTLGLSSSGTPTHARVGTSYTLTFTPSVTGTAYNHPQLVVTLPAGEEFTTTPTGATWSCGLNPTKTVATCTATVLSGLSTVVGTVDITGAGTLTMQATLSDTGDSASPATTTATVHATTTPTLIVKTTHPDKVEVGTPFTLTITPSVGPSGPAYHHPVVTVALPTGEHFTGAPTAPTWSCSKTTTATYICTSTKATPVAPTSPLGKLTVTIVATTPGTRTTTVTLSDPGDTASPATTTVVVTVTAVPTLGLSVSGVPTMARVTTTFTMTLHPTVTGTAYHHPMLVATLPGGERLNGTPSGATWNCGASTSASLVCTATALSTLSAVTAVVVLTAVGTQTVDATLSDPGDGALDATSSATTQVTATPTLVVKATGPTKAEVGTTYALTVTPSLGSSGPAYHSPAVTVTLPTGESFTGVPSVPGWTCVLTSSVEIYCTSTASKPIPATTTLGKITFKVHATNTGTQTAAVHFYDTTDGATPVTKTVTVKVTAVPTLGLTSTGTPAQARVTTTYPLTLHPTLTGTAYHKPQLVVTLPAGEKFTATPTGGTWSCGLNVTKTIATCTATVLSGLSTVTGTVQLTTSGSHTMHATLSDTGDSATPATTTATVDSTTTPTLAVKTTSPTKVEVNTPFTLTVTAKVGPTGPAYHDPVVTVTLPTGEKFTGTPAPAGWTCKVTGQKLTCTSTKATPIAPTTTLGKITVKHRPTTPGTHTIKVKVSDPTDTATPVTKTVTVKVTAVPTLGLTSTGTPAQARVTTTYPLTLHPTLTGTAYHKPQLVVTLPAGEKFTATPTGGTWSCGLNVTKTIATCTATVLSGLSTVTGTVQLTTSGSHTMHATLSDTGDSATPATTTATVDSTTTPTLAVKTTSPTKVEVNTPFTLTVTAKVGPTGPAYHDPVVTVTLPTGEKFTGTPAPAGWTCKVTGQKLTCTSTKATPIAPTTTLGKITVKHRPTTPGTHTIKVKVSDPTDTATPVTKTVTVKVTAVPTLGLTSTGTPAQARVTTTYPLTLHPTLTGTAYHKPQLVVTLPAGEKFTATPTGGTWSCGLNVTMTIATCTATVLSGLSTVTGTVQLTTSGSHTMHATLSDTGDSATPATTTATVDSTTTPTLAVKTTSPTKVEVNTPFTLTVTAKVGPTGPAYHDPVVTVTLPTGEKFTGTPAPAGWTCKVTGQKLTCTSTKATPIAPTTTLGKVTVKIVPTKTGTLTTKVTVTDPGDTATPVTKTVTVQVTAVPTLGLTSTGTPAQARVTTTYPLTLHPTLTGTAYHKPQLVVTLPAGEKFTATPTGGTWSCGLNVTKTIATCTATVLSGLSTVTGTVQLTTSGSHTMHATLSDTGDSATPATTTATVDSTTTPTLAVKTTSPTKVEVNTPFTLTVTAKVGPTGPAYHDPVVTVTLPTGEKFTGTPAPAGWTCKVTGQKLTCTSTKATPIAPTTTLGKVTVKIVPTKTGTLTTKVTVTDPGDTATPVTKTVTVKATPVPVLGLTMSGIPAKARVGTGYTLTLTPSVTGTAYHHPKLVVTLPGGQMFTTDPTPAGWECALSNSTRTLTCTATVLTGLGKVVVGVHIAPTAEAGAHTVSATLSDDTDGATAVTRTGTVTVTAVPVLTLTSSGTPAQATPGSNYTLTLNPGLSVAGGLANHKPVVTATLPAGETFGADPAPAGWHCSLSNATRTLTCTSTATTPIVAGTGLGTVSAVVDVASTASGLLTTRGTLSDPTDGAAPVSVTAMVTVKAKTTTPTTTTPTPGAPIGYRLVGGDGGVFAYGAAPFKGSLISEHITPTSTVTGIASTPDGQGYWLCDQKGAVFAFGDAPYEGTLKTIGVTPVKPIVGIASTGDGKGYWLVASDGGVFAFGDARFYGNTYTLGIENRLDKPMVGITPTTTGGGYWLVAADGGVFAFGNAKFSGNTYTIGYENKLTKPIVGIAASPRGKGYWLVAADGGVFAFGGAQFKGNTYTINYETKLVGPMVGISAMPDGQGYWLGANDGGVFAFGDALFLGNTYTTGIEKDLNAPMTGIAFSK